jgi:Flp pilus assembly pilin Flp
VLWFRQRVLRLRSSGDARAERGATAVEYGLIVALFVVGMFGAVTMLRTSLNNSYNASEARVGSPQSQLAAPSLPSYDPTACGGDVTKWQNPLTGACETSQKQACAAASSAWSSASNECTPCSASEWFNSSTVACDVSTQSSCSTSSQGWDSATNTCVACSVTQPFDSGTGTCKATAANCPVTSPFDATSSSCKATSTNCPAATPLDTATSTCKATAANCPTVSPARYFNSGAGTCDVIPTCADPAQPYDSTSNTCKATATNCVPPRYLNGSACALPTAPGTPAAPSATAGVKQVSLTWTAPTTGGSPITGYAVECKTAAAVSWTSYGTVTGTSTTVTGLLDNTAYTCRVSATNSVGTSATSAASNSVTTAGAPSTPAAPTVAAGVRQVTVTWVAPADGGSAITGYTVECRAGTGAYTSYGPFTGTSTTITGLANNTSYNCRVTATNAVGNSTASSNSTPVTTPNTPGAPGTPTLTTPNAKTIRVAWTAPASNGGSAITTYGIQYRACTTWSSGSCSLWGAWQNAPDDPTSPTTISGLVTGTRYQVQVLARNAVGNGTYSTISAVIQAT